MLTRIKSWFKPKPVTKRIPSYNVAWQEEGLNPTIFLHIYTTDRLKYDLIGRMANAAVIKYKLEEAEDTL